MYPNLSVFEATERTQQSSSKYLAYVYPHPFVVLFLLALPSPPLSLCRVLVPTLAAAHAPFGLYIILHWSLILGPHYYTVQSVYEEQPSDQLMEAEIQRLVVEVDVYFCATVYVW